MGPTPTAWCGAFGPCAAGVRVPWKDAVTVPVHAATSAINVGVLAMLLAPYKEPDTNSFCPKEITS